mmetsp:Transcript_37677/g.82928  ORF Transcript_37677/g.82928 Transcript_37677/m.82928 type:complete len:226 (+) Transcript_37677:1461-2138(+)
MAQKEWLAEGWWLTPASEGLLLLAFESDISFGSSVLNAAWHLQFCSLAIGSKSTWTRVPRKCLQSSSKLETASQSESGVFFTKTSPPVPVVVADWMVVVIVAVVVVEAVVAEAVVAEVVVVAAAAVERLAALLSPSASTICMALTSVSTPRCCNTVRIVLLKSATRSSYSTRSTGAPSAFAVHSMPLACSSRRLRSVCSSETRMAEASTAPCASLNWPLPCTRRR